MLGEQLNAVALTPLGVLGDRGWAVRDEERGGIRGAKKLSPLMRFGARYLREPTPDEPTPHIEIALPDGGTVRSDDPEVAARLSSALDHDVTLWPLQPPSDLDHYRRGAPDSDDLLAELRGMFGRTEDEPLPDLSVFPPEIVEFESLPGTYYDAFPLLLMTTTSLRSLEERAPGSAVDVRRFRPNVLLDTDDGGAWPEQSWVGRRFGLGSTVLEVTCGCPRCVMITLPVAELPADRSLMRTVVREADQLLGAYATVVEPGEVRVGDQLVDLG